MNLAPHFTDAELTFSSTAERLGIDNTPDGDVMAHLRILASGLEQVRTLLGHPMHIDSGYRCSRLNAAVGGSATSAHVLGYAADFLCAEFGAPIDIVHAIQASVIAFDQCIQEGTWVHISFDPRARREVMTAHFAAGQPTKYTIGA